ncbi:NAD(P)H-dependent glycerol-3-phosphate dehydrogenase [Paraliomyxa miuraensis]|uniref:NAD(P)H-dependent glycerol-3-phosphate dehydrogenase n=1 Tax=Paraliomyxa miuraensis TaxID=376150 RepID=UPI00225013A1|nr:NAD(P)H-dependent glycerol-3-phosphate dehydrogenase [Paraliomyxa miuraensis]MCX4245870.1 NAD(P)-dependent glycerol-3-phosphate dehydrogenase [Paraliomyxa miuraensis]
MVDPTEPSTESSTESSVEPQPLRTVAVLGAGSWGTALAIHCARRGRPTVLWTRTTAHHQAMTAEGRNARYLPDAPFPSGLTTTDALDAALAGADLVICAIPSHGMREAIERVASFFARDPSAPAPMYLIAAKGIEVDSLSTMHQVLAQELAPLANPEGREAPSATGGPAEHHERIAALGGPSFAAEVAKGLPTTVVVGAQSPAVGQAIQRLLSGDGVRAYVTDDILGVELGGTFKNVIALAAGVGDGAGLGQNARAGLITRGLAEMSRLAVALGALPATLAGLAGIGDLVLTCTGGLSRNRRVGIALGEGKTLEEILGRMGMVAEGVKNTLSAQRLAQREGVDMPLVATMHAILYEGMAVQDAVDALMGRKLKAEREW